MGLRRRMLHPIAPNTSQPYDDFGCLFPFSCPPPPEPSPEEIPVSVSHSTHHLTNLLIAGCSLLGISILIFAALFFTLRRRRRRLVPPTPAPPSDDPSAPLADPIDHHVWHIRTVGLDAATIASISIVRFKPGEGLIDGSDCAVCLAEFRDGEDLRLLPKCSHAFHLPCIDTWLRSRVSCPLCRAPIVTAKEVPAPASESTGLELSLGEGSESVDGERTAAIEERDGERMIEIVIGSCSQGSSSETMVPEDWQPVRRSVSMDASSLGALLLRGEPEEKKDDNFEEECNHKKRGKQGSDVKMETVKNGMVRMGRSLSSSGRWFHLSRCGRLASTTVLPV